VEKRPIVIDTNLLLTYLAIRYLDGNDAPKARRDQVLTEIRGRPFDETERERFLELIKQHAFTTAHAISEALNLRVASALSREKEEFRRNSLEVLMGGTISEISCPIAEICKAEDFRQLICRYDLTDAGLIFVAAKSKALVLTDDGRLSVAIQEIPVT
jgi:aspartyl-tRNA synthetase